MTVAQRTAQPSFVRRRRRGDATRIASACVTHPPHTCGVRSSSAPTFRHTPHAHFADTHPIDEDEVVDTSLFTRRTSVAPPSAKLGKLYRAVLLLGFGCVKAAGQKNRLLRKLAFFPPEPAGYMMLVRKVWESTDLEAAAKTASSHWAKKGPCGAFSIPHPSFRSAQTHTQYTITECSLILRSSRHADGIDPTVPLQHVGDGSFRLFAGLVRWRKEPAIAFAVIWRDASHLIQDQTASDLEWQIRRSEFSLPSLRDQPLILFSHGNSTDIGYSFVSYVQLAHRVHANVLAYDYHGYGASEGKLTDKTGARNLEVVYKLAVNVFHVPPSRIIIYGQSIGTTSTCVVASKPNEFPVGGVILHSPIASGLRLLLGNAGRIPFLDVFHNAELIVNCPWPIQFIHGGKDCDVPLWHCQLLHELAIDPGRPGKSARDRFVHEVSSKVECTSAEGGLVASADLVRSRTDRPCRQTPGDAAGGGDETAALDRWWSRRVHVWIAEEAGHNDVEVKYKKEYFNVIRNFITSYVT